MAFEAELETAKQLAKTAGEEILRHYANEIIAEEKLGVDQYYEPVTEADRAASRIIVAGLSKAFPDDGILSEEEDDIVAERLGKERVWIVDPIDGTAGFVRKDGDFAVQIGLADRGRAVVGVVLLPFHGITYFATSGGGSFREASDKTSGLKTSKETDYSKMFMAVSRNHPSSRIRTVLERFGVAGELSRGSVGLKIGLIAEQRCDLYIHLSHRTKLWDTCAPQVILEEAGGRVTDLFGNDFRYDVEDLQNYGGVCATNGSAHGETIARLKPLLSEFGRPNFQPRASGGQP